MLILVKPSPTCVHRGRTVLLNIAYCVLLLFDSVPYNNKHTLFYRTSVDLFHAQTNLPLQTLACVRVV